MWWGRPDGVSTRPETSEHGIAKKQYGAPTNKSDAVRVSTENWENDRAYYADQIELTERCKDFLYKQEHYANDPGVTLDDARIAPKGAELNDQYRYKLAQILAEGPYVSVHPRDYGTDPAAAESAKRVLMSIVEDNTNRYMKFRRRVVGGALAVGTWYGMVHWIPDRGPFGDLAFESLGPDQVFPCAGYLDLHDPMCPRVTVERHLSPDVVANMPGWKNNKGLWPDNHGTRRSQDEWQKADGDPSPDDTYLKDTVTVIYSFYRNSGDTDAYGAGHRDLADEDQYMACPACDFQDKMHERMPDGSLPEVGYPCPQCLSGGGDVNYLFRVEREKLTEQRLKYPHGKLCIVAPFHQRLLYEGPWQAPTRSFPLLQVRAYESPYELMGGCDTLLYWSLQALLDSLRKQFYDQIVTSKPLIIMGANADGSPGLVDSQGSPYLYDSTSGQLAYYNGPPGMISQIIHQFSPNGITPSGPMLFNILSQSFYQTRGVGQVQFGPDQSKDVAYRSLLLQKETGDIPVEDHKQIWREEEGLFLGCALDVWVHHSTEARAVRYLGPDGNTAFQLLKGSDIPNVDVVVGAPPQIKQGAIDEIQAMLQWSQIPIPALRRVVARRLNLTPSEVSEVEAELMAQQQAMAGPPQPGPGAMGNGGPSPEAMAAALGAQPPVG